MSRYLTEEELNAIRAGVPKYGGGNYKALLAEVDMLRAEVDLLQREASIRRAINDGLVAEVDAERAAVVAWLRDVAETMNHNGDKCCGRVEDLADAVARGEHRREEKYR